MGDMRELLKTWAETMEKNREYLIELDGAVGDSDLGLTMADGYRAAYIAARDSDETDAGKLCYLAGKAMGAKVPSTMGTLMASGLMNAGKAFRGVESIEDSLWPAFFEAYFEGVQNRGKARLGDKTFLDGLYPAIEALKVHGGDLRAASSLAAQAAADAFHATRGMLARQGRMAIRGEQSREYLDPGAAGAALLMQGFAQIG